MAHAPIGLSIYSVLARAATDGGWALGTDRFKAAMAKALGRRVTPLPRGRKPKVPPNPRQSMLL